MKSNALLILIAAAAIGAILFLVTERPLDLPQRVSLQREAFGTAVTITVYDRDPTAAQQAMDEAFARIAAIEAIASTHDESSELSELHRSYVLPDASDELVAMFRLAQIVHRLSDGAFDITAGTLTALWEETPASDVQSASVAEALRHVGMERIYLGSGRRTSVSLVPGTRIDLEGIGIGYAVDQAVVALRDAGIESALIQAGAAVRAYGGRPDGSPWEIDLADSMSATPVARLRITEGAIAAVGAFARSVDPQAGGTSIPDPRTGNLATASSGAAVLAPTCAEAEALAVAVFILGPDAGVGLVDQLGKTEALVAGFDDSSDLRRSSGFAAFETVAAD